MVPLRRRISLYASLVCECCSLRVGSKASWQRPLLLLYPVSEHERGCWRLSFFALLSLPFACELISFGKMSIFGDFLGRSDFCEKHCAATAGLFSLLYRVLTTSRIVSSTSPAASKAIGQRPVIIETLVIGYSIPPHRLGQRADHIVSYIEQHIVSAVWGSAVCRGRHCRQPSAGRADLTRWLGIACISFGIFVVGATANV